MGATGCDGCDGRDECGWCDSRRSSLNHLRRTQRGRLPKQLLDGLFLR